MDFATVFKLLCKEEGITQKQALAEMSLGRNAAQRWINGWPSFETLSKISAFFGIPIDILSQFMETEDEEYVRSFFSESIKKEPAPSEGNGLSDYDIKLLEWFRSLPPEKRQSILALADAPEELRED